MSRGKAIGGVGLLSLVLLGVLAALAQTAEKPPTELYVRTTPPGAKVFVDGKELGTSPSLIEVEPGEHTIVVTLQGHQPRTRKVTIPDGRIRRVILELQKGPEARDQQPEARGAAWGEPVEGVQCRLQAENPTWPQGTMPKLLADLRNRGKRNLRIEIEYESWEIEIDGTWHRPNTSFTRDRHYLPLGPAAVQQNLEVWIPEVDNLAERLRALKPGKHTLRVARLLNDSRRPGEEILRLVSNPIEIEIVPAEARPKAPDQEPAWGEQVEGLQCRIRAEKATWTAGTVPKLFGDLRSMDMWHPDPSSASENWEIEIDGKWHKNQRAKLLGSHRYTAVFVSGNSTEHDVQEVVYQLAIDAEQTAARSLRALAPGKHVLRAGYRFDALPPNAAEFMRTLKEMYPLRLTRSGKAVHVVSNPIEIEIVAAEAAAASGVSGEPKLSPRKLFSASHGADVGVLGVAFSPDGQTVAAVDETGKVILRDAGSGRQLWGCNVLTPEEKKRLLYEDRQGRIHTASIAFSPDGYTLAVAADPVVRLYDAQSGRLLRVLEDKQLVEQLKELKRPPATVSRELELLEAVPHAHGRVYCVAFSPDGTVLATSGSHLIRADGSSVISAEVATRGKLKLWDAKTGELRRDLGEHFGAVRSVAFSPDGKTLASLGSHPPSWTSSVRLWDPQTGTVKKVLRILPHSILETAVAFSPDGKLVAAGALVTGLREDGPDDGIERLGAGHRCRLLVFKAQTGEPLFSRDMAGPVTSVDFSADGNTLATGVDGRGVTLWDPETLKPKGEIQLSKDLPRDVQVAFSPTGNLLAVGAKDAKQGGFVTVWEIGEPVHRPTPAASPAAVPHPDEKDAVGVIKKLGGELKLRSDGTVRSVSFKGKPVTDADLLHLEKLAGLEELDLSSTQTTDAGLAHLEGLAGLETLDLSGTRVSDAAVVHLNRLAKLHRLDLTNTQFSADGARQLFLPELYQFGYRGPEPPKVEPRKMLLAKAEGAGEKSVLDLASGETLPLSDQAMRDPSAFTRLGKGDFWYGGDRVVCLRGAKATYLDDDAGVPEEAYRGRPDTTSYKLPEAQRIEYVESGEKKQVDRPRRLRITTAEKRHFIVAILSVTKEGDAVLEYQSADNPFKTKWDPTFRLELAGVAAIDLDTGAITATAPLVEKWPDAFELVWNENRRAVMCRHGSPTRVIPLRGVKSFEEATDQALRRDVSLPENGEQDRIGAASEFDEPGTGPDDARYFAFLTNRGNLAIVEIVPGRPADGEAAKGWIRWSVGEIEGFRGDVPPLVTPVRRLPAADQRALRR